jgi:hypothetical protein
MRNDTALIWSLHDIKQGGNMTMIFGTGTTACSRGRSRHPFHPSVEAEHHLHDSKYLSRCSISEPSEYNILYFSILLHSFNTEYLFFCPLM